MYCRYRPKADALLHEVELTAFCLRLDAGTVLRGPQLTDAHCPDAEIWINGKKVAGPDEVVGAFRRYELNVTAYIHPGATNALAVEVTAPKAGELGITWREGDDHVLMSGPVELEFETRLDPAALAEVTA